MNDYDGLLDDAYNADEKPRPSVRNVQSRDVDEPFLERLDKGVLYRFRR